MANGHDHPGTYRFLPQPPTPDEQKALAEAQEAEDFYLVAMDGTTMAFYKKLKKGK